jgi:hypothetical protein
VQRGRVSSLTTLTPLFSQTLQRECTHLCNVDGHLPQPPSYREWVRLCNVDRSLLSKSSPCDVIVTVCATWVGTSSRLSHLSLHPAGARPSVQRGWLPPPATPFLSRMGPSVQRGPIPTLDFPPCDVRVPACAMWAGTTTSFSPLLPLLLPDTPGDRPIRRGIDSPLRTAPRRTSVHRVPRPIRASRPATCAAPYVPRPVRALRHATCTTPCVPRLALPPRRRCNLYSPATLLPTFPRFSYIISKNRTDSCEH